jgi:hypothetical protein
MHTTEVAEELADEGVVVTLVVRVPGVNVPGTEPKLAVTVRSRSVTAVLLSEIVKVVVPVEAAIMLLEKAALTAYVLPMNRAGLLVGKVTPADGVATKVLTV